MPFLARTSHTPCDVEWCPLSHVRHSAASGTNRSGRSTASRYSTWAVTCGNSDQWRVSKDAAFLGTQFYSGASDAGEDGLSRAGHVAIGCRGAASLLILLSSSLLAACAPSPSSSTITHIAPLPDTSRTPRGWAPLGLGSVQISVPSGWFVQDPEWTCGGEAQGWIFINQTPTSPPGSTGCPLPKNVVELSTDSVRMPGSTNRAVINSIPATEGSMRSGSTSTEVVRALGTVVTASGPFARQVLATLTHSPLSVVLDSSVSTVPPRWRRVVFGGVSFAVPGKWTRRRASWADCPGNVGADTLVLNTARVRNASSCGGGPPPWTAGYLAGSAGMELASGPNVSAVQAGARCLTRQGLRFCIDPPPPAHGGFVPGHELDLLTAQIDGS